MRLAGFRIVFSFLLLVLLVSCKNDSVVSSNTSHDDLVNFKLAFVDRKVVESKMVALKNIEKSFMKEEGKVKNDLLTKKNRLEEKYKSLEKSKSDGILDRKALESKAKEIEKEFFELQQLEREAGELVNFVKMQIAFEINQKIQEAAREIGDKSKYLVVFDGTTLFYIDNNRVDDLTFEVIHLVNDNFKKLEIEKYFDSAKKALEKMKKATK